MEGGMAQREPKESMKQVSRPMLSKQQPSTSPQKWSSFWGFDSGYASGLCFGVCFGGMLRKSATFHQYITLEFAMWHPREWTGCHIRVLNFHPQPSVVIILNAAFQQEWVFPWKIVIYSGFTSLKLVIHSGLFPWQMVISHSFMSLHPAWWARSFARHLRNTHPLGLRVHVLTRLPADSRPDRSRKRTARGRILTTKHH